MAYCKACVSTPGCEWLIIEITSYLHTAPDDEFELTKFVLSFKSQIMADLSNRNCYFGNFSKTIR